MFGLGFLVWLAGFRIFSHSPVKSLLSYQHLLRLFSEVQVDESRVH